MRNSADPSQDTPGSENPTHPNARNIRHGSTLGFPRVFPSSKPSITITGHSVRAYTTSLVPAMQTDHLHASFSLQRFVVLANRPSLRIIHLAFQSPIVLARPLHVSRTRAESAQIGRYRPGPRLD